MDKEQAKFVLESCQVGSIETEDPSVVEALAVVANDPELAAWLSETRSLDAAFAEALNGISVPELLPSMILERATSERVGLPEPEDDLDAQMMGALAGIKTPENLRARVLVAMDRSVHQKIQKSFWRRFSLPMAAAAGIMLALIFESTISSDRRESPLSVGVVQTSFIRAYESPLFSLDEKEHDSRVLLASLQDRGLPCPECLPPGLQNLKGIGCREFSIDGKKGAVICFHDDENGAVHLVVFRLEDVDCRLPGLGNPSINRQGPWVAARWQDQKNAFVLVSASDEKRLAKLFGKA